MKNILSIAMLILFANFCQAQNKDYKSLWNEVSKLESKGLPKSALEVVENIAQQAKKDNNTPQVIKTLLFKSKFALVLEEDAQLKILNDFKAEINTSATPTKNVLENLLANLYWQYFQQNRWTFYNRTNTNSKVDAEDFRTWDLQTLFDEIHLHYQNSLDNGLILQQTPIDYYKAIIVSQKESKLYRPSLFDFLSNNALAFYKTNETSITKPAYKFQIDNTSYLSNALTFSKVKLVSKDTSSLQLHALKIYQNLIKFHIKDTNPQALTQANIDRLKFVKEHATFNDKEELYIKALLAESKLWSSHEISGLYDFEIASIYVKEGQGYQLKKQDVLRWKIKDALEICNTVISKFPNSKAAINCEILRNTIFQRTLSITAENHIPIQQHSRVLINYKNLEAIDFKIFRLTREQLKRFNKKYNQKDKESFLSKLKTTNTWSSKLQNESDYQTHSTEVVLPKLDNGLYLIVATVENDKPIIAFKHIQITNMAVVDHSTNGTSTYQVINRNNGQPFPEAKVKISYKKGHNGKRITKNLTTNSNGEVTIKQTPIRYVNVEIEVTHKDEIAYFGDYYIYHNQFSNTKNNTSYNGFLFTDRSIYRPGQIVYFKGIAMKTFNGKSEVFPDTKLTVTIKDANYQEVKTLDFITNDFGSFNGEFVLPENGLNGNYNFNISSEKFQLNANANISVEEYKRPKFETKFKPVTETYKVNDSITIKGNALAFAGANITDAKVMYRVYRKVQYPAWYYWRRPSFFSESQEISHGKSITNSKGEFEITFKALPDENVNKNNLPIFHYEVTADVTDLNGETRSATATVNVGYHALLATISSDNRLDKTNKDHIISIDTKNLNGEFTPAKGHIKIYKLLAPSHVLRPRPWQAPDYQTLNEADFKLLFPHEAYNNESNSNTWEKGALVFETAFDTETSKELPLKSIKKWNSGQYVIVLDSEDKFGQDVKDESKISVFSPHDKTLADHQLFSISTDKDSYQPNDIAQIIVASAMKDLYVSLAIEKDNQIVKEKVIHLNNNKESITIPVTTEDIGGFVVHYSFSAYNSYEGSTLSISVPYPKTDLEIETLTFRDKLQPGADETWNFKIKGPKGEKVSAEVLASMYDASLDQFKPHAWQFHPINTPQYYSRSHRNAGNSFGQQRFRVYNAHRTTSRYPQQSYDSWNWFGLYFGNNYIVRSLSGKVNGLVMNDQMVESESVDEVVVTAFGIKRKKDQITSAYQEVKTGERVTLRGDSSISGNNQSLIIIDGEISNTTFLNSLDPNLIAKVDVLKGAEATVLYGEKGANGVIVVTTKNGLNSKLSQIKIRKNLKETAFFFPQLRTDADGHVSFSFKTSEALTQWKLQLLAHTKSMESSVTSLETVTQKELMVIPNAPRFLREEDEIVISSKIANLTDKQLSGEAVLQLFDATTGNPIDKQLFTEAEIPSPNYSGTYGTRQFTVDAHGNTQVSWLLYIPDNVQVVQYKVIAKSGDYSDGEQNALPVLTNRMLVTETLPMWIRSNETKAFSLDKLKTTTSTSLKHHNLSLEITSNPAWYAVQALPYLMEYPYDCNEQTFSRYYANALASHISNSNPRIQEVFNQWKNTDALLSNLEKNQELKSILIQETPWLRDAQSETEQKKRIALLFDLNKMTNELQSAKRKLEQNQMSNGAWSWFAGGRENRYITQHIITGFGHLKHLNVSSSIDENSQMIQKAIAYLDVEFIKEYKNLKKYNRDVDLKKDHLSHTQLHYLYMRSFFKDIKTSDKVNSIMKYYHTQIENYWLNRSLYAKGMMALVMHREDKNNIAEDILNSLKETSITSDELGMYWKANTNSWYWYEAPIETQALLIETFAEIDNDVETIDNLKIWLLKNKQTNRWKTTKATTEAVYALLLQGSDWLSVTEMVDVVIGGQTLSPKALEDVKVEAGTGYYKTSWKGDAIQPKMADVTLTKKGNGIAWGSLYWQYFENLDKITSSETPLKLKKKLFLKKNTDIGEELTEITIDSKLQVGDLVRVRIELRADRPMEFVHMKDMRASGLEPINVLSQYKWQDGLGYYESTKDASTNFFFDNLPKGIFIFEYDLRVNNAGDMSNGITTIQSMYAPEFSSHSEGVKIRVE